MTEIIREFIVTLQVDVSVEKDDEDYEELADALDYAQLMSLIADGMKVDLDSFSGQVREKVEGSTVTLGVPIIHNVYDVTGEDMTPYLEPNYDASPHLKSEVKPREDAGRKGHTYARDE
mgnify:CR=1 FL=1